MKTKIRITVNKLSTATVHSLRVCEVLSKLVHCHLTRLLAVAVNDVQHVSRAQGLAHSLHPPAGTRQGQAQTLLRIWNFKPLFVFINQILTLSVTSMGEVKPVWLR